MNEELDNADAMKRPSGWYPDPKRLHQYRWWDGEQWTDYVQATPNKRRSAAKTAMTVVTTIVLIGASLLVMFVVFLAFAFRNGVHLGGNK